MAWLQALVTRSRLIWTEHRGEVIAAIVIGVIVGIPFAAYFAIFFDRSEPAPYNLYIVASPTVEATALTEMKNSPKLQGLEIGGIKVLPNIQVLEDDTPEAADKVAKYIVEQRNALLVIGNMFSQPTEHSLPIYFNERPQIPFIATVQTDEELLRECKEACYAEETVPLLQLSPMNTEQAQWAIQFATEHDKSHFLIVHDTDSTNKTYTDSLIRAYHKALTGLDHGFSVEVHEAASISEVPQDVRTMNIDCVLYAGGLDDGSSLLREVKDSGQRLMIILSDSAVDGPKIRNNPKLIVRATEFASQSEASDFNHQKSTYGMDGIAIASQLIDDLNKRGFDWRYQVKARFNRQSLEDVRRNLARTMRENIKYRSSYVVAKYNGEMSNPSSVYAFGYDPVNARFGRRAGGMFHVWEWDPSAKQMADVDKWHPLNRGEILAARHGNHESTPLIIQPQGPDIRLAAGRQRLTTN